MLTRNMSLFHVVLLMVVTTFVGACTLTATVQPEATALPPPSAVLGPIMTATPLQTGTPDLAVTLAVPTPLPAAGQAQAATRLTVSALQRIREENAVRFGVLYNNAPMSSFSERGQVVGYEADLARQIAALWGVDVRFVQVTRQNAVAMVLAGEVDMLLASLVHRREYETVLSFSHSYFPGGQVFVVPPQSAVQSADQLNGQPLGVVQGSTGEHALGRAIDAGQYRLAPVLYLTMDQAIGALGSGEVSAIVLDRVYISRVLRLMPEARVLDEVLEPGPIAAAFRRYDEPLRYFVNRALQRLASDGSLAELRRQWLPNLTGGFEMPVWAGLDEDPRGFADFDPVLVLPVLPVFDRIRAGQSIRVAGLDRGTPANSFLQRTEGFYEAVITEMAARWGVLVTFIPDSSASALDLLASGQADLAVGVTPRWDGPYEVAYSAPIIAHGNRLMRPVGSPIEGFADLRGGRWVGILASQPGTADQVNALAAEVNAVVNIFTIVNDEDAAYAMLVDQNADVVYGDSLRLQPVLEANAGQVELTGRWYTREYNTLAVPRHDPDFLTLVEVTLQDIAADGTFEALWQATSGAGEPVAIEQWPGLVETGFDLSAGAG